MFLSFLPSACPSRCHPRSESWCSVCATTCPTTQGLHVSLLTWQQFSQNHMCRIYENTQHKTSIQVSTISILNCYNSGYSTLSSVPSLVFRVCQCVRLRLPDLHGHDHLADVAAAGSTCGCRRLHREHAIGGQRGADVLQVDALGQPEGHKRKETSSQTGAHFCTAQRICDVAPLVCSSLSWLCRRPTCISE